MRKRYKETKIILKYLFRHPVKFFRALEIQNYFKIQNWKLKITRLFYFLIFSRRGKMISIASIGIIIVGLVGYRYFTRPLPTLTDDLQKIKGVGEQVKNDFQTMPSVALAKTEKGYELKDDLKAEGIKIQNNSQDGLEIQNNTPEEEKPKQEIAINFPKDYSQPMEVNLPQKGQILITDNSKEKFASQILTNEVFQGSTLKNEKIEPLEEKPEAQYLKYSAGRKSIYYSYQKDQALGERKLKNWLVYQKGNGQEQESYTFQNAKLELDQQGQVKVFFDDGKEKQNQQAMADVEPSLMERARQAIMKDTGEDITKQNEQQPDFTIPQAYYIGKDGERKTLDWKIENQNTLKLEINTDQNNYPLALDPTLQFTAPGTSTGVGIITGEAADNNFGVSLATGDLNADGRTDLAVGAYYYDRIYIFFNDGSIPAAAGSADTIITGEAGSWFGYPLATGDLNADRRTDLAVGAYNYNSGQGRAYIFLNDGSYPTDAGSADTIITGEAGSYFGASLATGDLNADGRTDLAVGASSYNSGQGRAYIFLNDGSYPTDAGSADTIITGEAGSEFGYSLATGDLNADGRTDLAVGASSYNSTQGRTYIFLNDVGGIPTDAGSADTIITGEAGSYFGWSLATGDLNADGRVDLAVGARRYNSWQGRAYIFLNDGSIPTDAGSADTIITGEAGSEFGYSLATGDLNADGRTDLAVGASAYNSTQGRAYIFLNDGSIPTAAGSAETIITGEADSYFGISLATGDLNADGRVDLAVGAMRYNSYKGRTYIFTSTNGVVNGGMGIEGEGPSNFGAVMTTGDLNNDTYTDLAVGGSGKVYIFLNDGSIPPAAGSADTIITGEAGQSNFGASLATGDLNYDGKTDLAVGASTYNSTQGRAYIFLNDGSIPTAAGSADTIITGEATSYFGYSLATGDLNADGRTDLAVGAYRYNAYQGRAYIFLNDVGGIPTAAGSADTIITGEASSNFGYSLATGDLNADGRVDLAVGAWQYNSNQGRAYIFLNDVGGIPTTAGSADTIITGEAGTCRFGESLTSGDLNADGRTDLAVGASAYNSGQGRTYIFLNDVGGIPTTAGSADTIITGEADSWFGNSLATGDLNADGRVDLAVGAWQYNSNQGRAYIFLNDVGGIPTDAGSADTIITGEANSYFGRSLATGDLNADGRTDLAVGASYYNSSQGRAYIFLNDVGGIPTVAGSADTIITGEAGSGKFGYSLAIGDLNADGRTDLIVGAYNYNSIQGRAYIFLNDGSIPTDAGSADTIITGENPQDGFGSSLATGDLNADGRTDLVVGATGYDYGNDVGRVYIFYQGNLPTSAASADVKITGEGYTNIFGASLATGDLNADGRTDLAVGAWGYNSNQGRAYIFLNDGSIPTDAGSADTIITGEANSWFGNSLVTGDLNADGRTDLAVGAYSYNAFQGRAYIFLNDVGGIPTAAGSADTIITGEANSYFGYSLATGDLNADGRTDLAVGAYGYNSQQGRAYIFLNDGSIPTAAGSADKIITGEAGSGNFGWSLATGDLNSDGRTDLAVGACQYNSNQGRAYIFLNDGSIPTTAGSADTIITGETGNGIFGHSLATGDLNADGRVDLAVGAWQYNSQGKIYFYTGQEKYSTALQRSTDAIRLQGAAGEELKITGATGGTYFGNAITTGDFNADGKMDLAVSANVYGPNKGRVYLFYNDGSIPISALSPDRVITGNATGDFFGASLAAGDFNNDGKTDLVVGANGYNSNQGRVYMFWNDGNYPATAGSADLTITGEAGSLFGSSLAVGILSNNVRARVDLAVGAYNYNSGQGRAYIFLNDGTIPTAAGSADTIITGEAGSQFGSSLAIGNLNTTRQNSDLVVGASAYGSYKGRIYIFQNDGTIPTAAGSADTIITGENADDNFGGYIAVGDISGSDGRTDLVAGASGYNSMQGRVYIFQNDGTYPASAADADTIITGEAGTGQFCALAVGDFNADGKTDIAASAAGYNSAKGRVYIFLNDGSYPSGAGSADTIIDGETNSSFGASLVSGDLNADGRTDLIVGAYGYNSAQGRVYIYTFNDSSVSGETGSALGSSMVAADLNADGTTDLAVSAPSYDSNKGRVYLFWNKNGSLQTTAANADTIITGETAGDYFGISLAAGNVATEFAFSGETTDLIVGATGYSSGKGRIYIFNNNIGAGKTYPTLAANVDTKITGETDADGFGSSLATGDLNYDGKSDLVVGAYSYPSGDYKGRVYVFNNDGSYPSSAANADTKITGENNLDGFGSSLATGDFNSDGKTDLAVGDWYYSSSRGRVYIFYQDNFPATPSSANAIINGENSCDQFGLSLAAADFNSDGKMDLAVGAGGYPNLDFKGRVYIFYQNNFPSAAASANAVITGESNETQFGFSLAAGDFNFDGKTDLAVGAEKYSGYAGRTYVFYNDGSYASSAANADLINTGDASSQYGASLATADINQDGKTDLAIGASGAASGDGKFYVIISEAARATDSELNQMQTKLKTKGTIKFKGRVQVR